MAICRSDGETTFEGWQRGSLCCHQVQSEILIDEMFINSKLYLQLCGRENSIDILPESIAKYNMSDNNKFKTIVVFDCRGLEPVDFSPRNGWKVK